MAQNSIVFSRFSIACAFVFAAFLLLSRFILPMGDEPDWIYRLTRLINYDYLFVISKDNISEIIFNSKDCNYENSNSNIFYYSHNYCINYFEYAIYRFYFSILPLIPLLIILILRDTLIFTKNYIISEQNSRRLDAVCLTLIYPSFIYYIGLLSEEQFFLCITIYIFIFEEIKFITYLFFIVLYYLDPGNFIVYVGGLLFVATVKFIIRYLGRWYGFLIPTIFLLVSYFYSYDLLRIFTIIDEIYFINILSKVDEIYNVLNNGGYSYDVPLIFRTLLTTSSAVLMTASGIKGILGYPIFAFGILFVIFKLRKLKLFLNKDFLLYIYSPITYIYSVVFLIPTHSNFKYYVFFLPNIFYGLLTFIDKRSIYSFNILLLITSFSIFFYYFVVYGNFYG